MKNCIILEIRDRSDQVVFALESDHNYGDEGVAKTFTPEEAAKEIDWLNRFYPNFRFQIVTLNPL